jgi:hypothetical protein
VNTDTPDTGVTVTSAVVGLVGEADMIAGAPSAGVLACVGADGGVAWPPESVATTWMSYVVNGFRPAIGQVDDRHVTVMGRPLFSGVTTAIKGPLVPGLGYI